ncbi:MAG: TetR/AcrR family transcriptional regulator [Acidimicrobiales bacterium]
MAVRHIPENGAVPAGGGMPPWPAGEGGAMGGDGGMAEGDVEAAGGRDPHPGEGLTRQARNRLRTRRRILDAGMDLFTHQGYDGTTIQEIADAADIALRTFYYHFDSKAGLAMAWFTDWGEDLAAAVDAQPVSASPIEVLTGALAAMAAKGYPGAGAWSDPEGRPSLPPQARALLQVEEPAFVGLIYQRLVIGFRRLAGVFRQRLGYAADAWEPYAIASAILSMWFVAVHGSDDMVGRGVAPPPFHVTVQQAFSAYAEGLEQLWADRPPTGTPPPDPQSDPPPDPPATDVPSTSTGS